MKEIGNAILSGKGSTSERGGLQIALKNEVNVVYITPDGKLKVGSVINMTEASVNMILFGDIIEKDRDTSLSCIDEDGGYVNIKVNDIVSTTNKQDGFSS